MRRALTLTFTLAFILIAFRSYTYKYGPGGGYTNAPGEGHCGNSGCHTGTSLNGGKGSTSNISLSNNFSGGGYIPDSTYTFKLSYSQSSIDKWGFSMTALESSNNDPAGSFAKKDSRTQTKSRYVSGKTRKYIEQTNTGTSSTGTNSVDWEFKWTAPSTNVGKIKFYTCINAANGNNSQSGDEIYAKAFEFPPSSLLPIARASAKATTVCANESVYLYGTGTNSPVKYEWSIPDGSPSSSSKQHPTTSFSTTGKKLAILRVQNAKGWSDYDTLTINVVGAVTSQILGNNARTMCPGDSVEMVALYHPSYTYLWSTGETAGNRIYAKKGGDYYVTVQLKSGGCAMKSNTVTVTELTTSTPVISSSVTSDTVCRLEAVTLQSSSGFDSLWWYKNGSRIGSSVISSFVVNYDTNERYSAKGWNSNRCLSDFSNVVEHKAMSRKTAPVLSCAEEKPFSVRYEWSGAGNMGVEVSEDKGKSWSVPSSGSQGTTHEMSNLYPEEDYVLWLREKTTGPCDYGETAMVSCRTTKCSPLAATLVADTMACRGDEVQVEVNGLHNESFSIALEGGMVFTDTIFSFKPGQSGDYLVEITDSAYLGCPPKRFELPVRVDSIPELNVRLNSEINTYCAYDTAILRVTGGYELYTLFVNDKLSSSGSDSVLSVFPVEQGDVLEVQVNQGLCVAKSDKIVLQVPALPDATFDYTRVHSIYTFSPKNKNYPSYHWDFGDGDQSGLVEPQHDYLASTNSSVLVNMEATDSNDCVATTKQQLTIPNFVSVVDLKALGIRIYPSPVSSWLTIEWEADSRQTRQIYVNSMQGEHLASYFTDENQLKIDFSGYTTGIYLIEVKQGEKTGYYRVVRD